MTPGTEAALEHCNLKVMEQHIIAISNKLTIAISIMQAIRDAPVYLHVFRDAQDAMIQVTGASDIMKLALTELRKG